MTVSLRLKSVLLLSVATLLVSFGHLAHAKDEGCDGLLGLLNKRSFHEALNVSSGPLSEIKTLFEKRTPEEQARINKELTRLHAAAEMSFQVKNPKTGMYDKFVEVPSNGAIAPILSENFARLTESTAPLMKTLRQLLQKIYSAKTWTVKSLGLGNLPREEAELFIRILRESIYFIPQLRSPVMRDYPFLSVAAFDGAVVDPTNPRPEFFEMNLGTPSGLSNNQMLLEELQQADPKLYRQIEDYLPADNTFDILRETIESNAHAWTKTDGLCVVMSPGVYNGAHPDVARIAAMTGMPLVRPSDLYEDAKGNIRLDLDLGEKIDPIVTGIYGRIEESYFLQSQDLQIPMINPQFSIPEDLKKAANVELRPGAVYDLEYDDKGNASGIKKDREGRPQMLKVFERIGRNPYRNDQGNDGAFVRAILNRKLYYSAIGGRMVDDKRLFRLITQYLVKRSQSANDLARPIMSLKLGEYEKFYEEPKRFVVKEPANSGGVGIYFPRVMSEPDLQALVERVKSHPGEFEIQYLSDIVTLPFSQPHGSEHAEINDVAIDLRLFTMMDAEGHVRAGPNSILLRTAPKGGLYTNTSRGGGYGVGVVLNSERHREAPERTRPSAPLGFQTMSKDRAAAEAIATIQKMEKILATFAASNDNASLEELKTEARALSFNLRELMDDLKPTTLRWIPELRNLADSDDAKAHLIRLAPLLNQIALDISSSGKIFRSNGWFKGMVFKSSEWVEKNQRDILQTHLANLPTAAKLRPLDPPEITWFYSKTSDTDYVDAKVEYAEYVWVDDPAIQAAIDEVKAFGGEVRYLARTRTFQNGDTPKISWEPSYFEVNSVEYRNTQTSYLKPIIAIDLSQRGALSALRHELEHFRMWKEDYEKLRREGLDHKSAVERINPQLGKDEYRLEGEKRAIQAEMKTEREEPNNPYAKEKNPLPREYFEYGYVNRVMYPEFEALRMQLLRGQWKDAEAAEKYMKEMVLFAAETRQKAMDYWAERAPKTFRLERWQHATIFELLAMPFGIERLTHDQTEESFLQLLKSTCEDLKIEPDLCRTPESLATSLADKQDKSHGNQ